MSQTADFSGDHCVIIGGGIGGLAAAIALQHFGFSATVFERAPQLREIGAGILLTPNAVWVLEQLGVRDALLAESYRTDTWLIRDWKGRVLQRFAARNGAFSVNTTRATLHDCLRAHLAASTLHVDHDATTIAKDADGRWQITFGNGSQRRCSTLIGADGGRSIVRKQVINGSPLRYCGYVGWRALVEYCPSNWPAGSVAESWGPGGRFGIAPVNDRQTYWYATENVPAGWSVPAGQRKDYLLGKFRDWHEPIREMIQRTPEEQILLHEISDHASPGCWNRDGAALIGDAAHLMSPNLGQGAALALEDAWVLAKSFAAHGGSERALPAFSAGRARRVAQVAWKSRQLGRLIQLQHPVLWRLRNLGLRLTPDWLGARSLSSVFDFRS
jgi:2-polyprenyl-6-methoxyphenol hydroxylase-like FAD-dependent oxidoreductase